LEDKAYRLADILKNSPEKFTNEATVLLNDLHSSIVKAYGEIKSISGKLGDNLRESLFSLEDNILAMYDNVKSKTPEMLKQVSDNIINRLQDTQSKLNDMTQSVRDESAMMVKEIVGGIQLSTDKVIQSLKNSREITEFKIRDMLTTLEDQVLAAIDNAKQLPSDVRDLLTQYLNEIKELPSNIKYDVRNLTEVASKNITELANKIKSDLSSGYNITTDSVKNAFYEVENALASTMDTIKSSPDVASQAVKDSLLKLKESTSNALDAFAEIKGDIGYEYRALISRVKMNAENLINKIENRTVSTKESMIDFLTTIEDKGIALGDTIKDLPRITSENVKLAMDNLSTVSQKALETLKNTPDWTSAKAKEALYSLEDAVINALEQVRDLPSNIGKELTKSLQNLKDEVVLARQEKNTRQAIDNVQESLNQAQQSLGSLEKINYADIANAVSNIRTSLDNVNLSGEQLGRVQLALDNILNNYINADKGSILWNTNKNVLANSLNNVAQAMEERDRNKLSQAGKELKEVGSEIPKDQGGKWIENVGEQLSSNPDYYLHPEYLTDLLKKSRQLNITDIGEISPDVLRGREILERGFEKYKAGDLPKPQGDVLGETIAEIEGKFKGAVDEKSIQAKQTYNDLKTYLDSIRQRTENIKNLDEQQKKQLTNDISQYLENHKSLRQREIEANKNIIGGLEAYLKNPSAELKDDVLFNQRSIQGIIDRLRVESERGISPEEMSLRESIGKDQLQLDKIYLEGLEGNEPLVAQITNRINENINRLNDLLGKNESGKLFNQLVDKKLEELGYSRENINNMTVIQKMDIISKDKPYISKLANDIARGFELKEDIEKGFKDKPSEGDLGRPVEPPKPSDKGGGIAVKEKVETKTETKTKVMTPEELEQLMNKKTESKSEEKVETKPEEKTEQGTDFKLPEKTETSIDVDQFIIPDADAVPYYAIVWENGQVFVKLITPEILTRGYVELATETGNVLINREDLNRMTPEQAQRLLKETDLSEYAKSIPDLMGKSVFQTSSVTQTQTLPETKTAPQLEPFGQPQQSPLSFPQPIEQPTPTSQTDTLTQTQLMPEVETRTALDKITRTSVKPIPKLPIMSDEQQSAYNRISQIPAVIQWRQGKKWISIPPREDGSYHTEDMQYFDKPLMGTRKFATGKGSAYKTLDVINGVPKKDADLDLGWAQIHISAKGKELQMSFGGGEEAANERWSQEQAEMDELERQSYTDLPQGSMNERIKGTRQRSVGLNKKLLPEYSTDDVKVYSVNGEFVRRRFGAQEIGDRKGIDFVAGGHSGVYWKLIPEDEVWIEENLTPEDAEATVMHELNERNDMLLHGKDYSEAHDLASEEEMKVRQNPELADDYILREIEEYREKSKVQKEKKSTYVPVKKDMRLKENRRQLQINPLDRYYLGRKLRPTGMGSL